MQIMDLLLYTFADLTYLHPKQIRSDFGGKALGLFDAYRIGLPVPPTWLISAKDCGASLDLDLFSFLPDQKYAVRSSAQAEDSSKQSYAGIFETVLDVERDRLPEAIRQVWASATKERASSYAERQSLMGVILQPMIEAKFAGVCFSKHPSPAQIFENGQIVIEFARANGEAVVQGTITPYRLSGSAEAISSAAEMAWIDELLKAVLALKKEYSREIDIEFVIDGNDCFWLLQERPISKASHSLTLDLAPYKRMYKRSLLSLDIEFLIEGCSLFLAPYLEIPFNLERWMVMTTDEEGIQELWVDELLNEAIDAEVRKKMEHDPHYLERLEMRYEDHYKRLMNLASDPSLPLQVRLFRWFEQMTPFGAHYYAPMFIIEALYTLLLRHVPENELFEWSRFGIVSLSDLLDQELRKKPTLKACKILAEKYGFLKCRQVFEEPYTAKELYEMSKELPEIAPKEKIDFSHFEKTYSKLNHWLLPLRKWMQIRNQEMEYLIDGYVKTRPLQLEACQELGISLETFWRSSKQALLYNPKKRFKSPAIVRSSGQTIVTDEMTLLSPTQEKLTDLKGRTVFGKGTLEAIVQIAYKPEELTAASASPTVLVTGMTTPDFVPYIRKSFAALITDEGGILCHAAIVAREISIPCIVGTGVATKILQNGMRVQIDFDRGEIAIL